MIVYFLLPVIYVIFPYLVDTPNNDELRRFSYNGRRIINGYLATDGQFPFFAEVINFQSNIKNVTCGGALISNTKVITAGHCLKDSVGIEVKFGSTKVHAGLGFNVRQRIDHPLMDFVVLKIDDISSKQNNFAPINIINRPVYSGEICTAIGFGWDGSDFSNEMRFTHLHINSPNDVYQQIPSYIPQSEFIYAGMNDNADVCFGDSGGPLLCKDGLAGITLGSIFKEPCNTQGLPSKFANLYELQHWINSI